MARGWESKAIEAQQEEAKREAVTGSKPSQEDRERASRRRTLELARSRAQADLQRARSEAHRTTLQQTLAALDEEIQRLR